MQFLKLNFKNKINPEKGKLLLSEPFMKDDYFSRAVVLLAEHDENGSFGFILNKPIRTLASDVLPMIPKVENHIHLGGPVNADNVYFLHTLGEEIIGAAHVIDNIYWGGDFDQLKFLLKKQKLDVSKIKFFAGYSGWTPGQLEQEMEENSWIVAHNPSAINIFDHPPQTIWQDVLKTMGNEFAHIAGFPLNPNDN